jgi:RNA polymerase sigma-70 factor, ECF subfamily
MAAMPIFGASKHLPLTQELTDNELLQMLLSDGEEAVGLIFRRHYAAVCRAAYHIIPAQETAEDLAQEVFYELWRKRDQLQIGTSLPAYLKRAAVNKALNHLRDKKSQWDDDSALPSLPAREPGAQSRLETEELQALIDQYVGQLPEKCRLVFVLSRFEYLSHGEIAERLDISTKTVENQITKALRFLKEALSPYLKLLLPIFLALQIGEYLQNGVFVYGITQ